jgi:hypothetical protein
MLEQLSGEWPYGFAPGTREYALKQVTALAAEGSQWPADSEATFRTAAAATGGYWVLAQCGEWLEGSGMPAGQPARVLLQLVFYLVDESEGYKERLYAMHTPAADQPDKPAAVLVEKPVSEVSQAASRLLSSGAGHAANNVCCTSTGFAAQTCFSAGESAVSMATVRFASLHGAACSHCLSELLLLLLCAALGRCLGARRRCTLWQPTSWMQMAGRQVCTYSP